MNRQKLTITTAAAIMTATVGFLFLLPTETGLSFAAKTIPQGGPDKPDVFPSPLPKPMFPKDHHHHHDHSSADRSSSSSGSSSSGPTVAQPWNVNLNAMVNLPVKTSYPSTTLQDYPCSGPGIAGNGKISDIDKENATNHAMWLSDGAAVADNIANFDHPIYWCGLER